MLSSERKVGTDVDNTLACFYAREVTVKETILAGTMGITGESRESVLAAMQAHVDQVECIESPGLLVTLEKQGLVRSEDQAAALEALINEANAIQPIKYEGIEELLLTARKNTNNGLFAITNAPAFRAAERVRQMGLEDQFKGMMAYKNHSHYSVPPGEVNYGLNETRVVTSEVRKPKMELETFVGLTRSQMADRLMFIGDSDDDIGQAAKYEAPVILAEWGKFTDEQYDRLLPFSPARFRNGRRYHQAGNVEYNKVIRAVNPQHASQILKDWTAGMDVSKIRRVN